MKKSIKTISLLLLVGFLVGCSKNNQNSSHSSEEQGYKDRIKIMDFSILDVTSGITNSNDPRYFEDAKPIDYYRKPDKVRMYYLDEINDVYYITLDNFAKVFKDDLLDGITSTNTETNGVATWTLTENNNELFKMSVDAHKKTISIDSAMEPSLVKPIYNGRIGVNDYCQMTSEFVPGYENKTRVFNFAKYNFDIFKVGDKYCYPFALLNAETSKIIERSFLYLSAYKELLKYGMKDQLFQTTFMVDNRETHVADYALNAFKQQYALPDDESVRVELEALRAFNKKLVYYVMDNSYGLAKEKGIKSMSDYFENFDYSALFESENSVKRGSAYFKAFQMLNDLHSNYEYSHYFSESADGDGSSIYSQTLYQDRIALKLYLTSARNDAIKKYNEARGTDVTPGEMRYSQDNKYGYFSFDEFNTFNYFGEGDVPEDTLIADAFYLFVKNLNEAKAKGTKRIIIDDSCNGGGYVTLMGKLLALMSKDNKSEMFLRDDVSGAIEKYTTRVDSNKDGVYDVNDCFGNDFEQFYIVTSKFSFSCGNAYPFYAQKNGLAKIVGESTGGGECCVFGYTLPTGQGLTYSSPYHIGYYDAAKNKYEGDEKGARPNYTISDAFYEIYDVDKVAQIIELIDNRDQ